LTGRELLRELRYIHRLEGRHLQPGQLLLQIGHPVLFFDGKLVLALSSSLSRNILRDFHTVAGIAE
jgi:hypothetical protein